VEAVSGAASTIGVPDDSSVTAAKMAANSVDSDSYVDGSIDLAHMSSESVDEDNLHISNAGSNGQFLSKQSGDAGGLTWAAPPGGGLVFIAQVTTSSGDASADFLSSFSSTYDNYLLTMQNVQVTSETAILSFRVAIGGAAKSDSGGYVYAANGRDEAGGDDLASAGNTMIRLHAGSAANGTGEGHAGHIYFWGANDTAQHKLCTWQHAFEDTSTVLHIMNGASAYQAATTALSGCQILSSSGTLIKGNFKLYGMVNS